MIVSINLFKSHWHSWKYLSNGYASGTLAKTNRNAKSYCLNVCSSDYLGESYHRVTIGAKDYIATPGQFRRIRLGSQASDESSANVPTKTPGGPRRARTDDLRIKRAA